MYICVYHNLHRNIPPELRRALFAVKLLPEIIETSPLIPSMDRAPVMYVMSTQVIQYNDQEQHHKQSILFALFQSVDTHVNTCMYSKRNSKMLS